MIACFDVHYQDDAAFAAAVLIENWTDTEPKQKFVVQCTDVKAYQAGSFYQRELKPLQSVLDAVLGTIPDQVDHFVIDAYCHLSADQSPGLGAYLHELLPPGATVIGVAKNPFRDTAHAEAVFRGESKRPLFVTSIGIDYSTAAEYVRSMAGENRIPAVLKAVDRLCRDAAN